MLDKVSGKVISKVINKVLGKTPGKGKILIGNKTTRRKIRNIYCNINRINRNLNFNISTY
jgi:hypothetical protein